MDILQSCPVKTYADCTFLSTIFVARSFECIGYKFLYNTSSCARMIRLGIVCHYLFISQSNLSIPIGENEEINFKGPCPQKYMIQHSAHCLVANLTTSFAKAGHTIYSKWIYYLLVSSADNLCKQIGPRTGPTKHLIWIQSVWHSDGILKIIFQNSLF